jgi:DNA polymerase-1
MIRIQEALKRGKSRSKMILQVHDELVIDVFKPEIENVIKIVVGEMEHAYSLSVPLVVDYGTGLNWLEAH